VVGHHRRFGERVEVPQLDGGRRVSPTAHSRIIPSIGRLGCSLAPRSPGGVGVGRERITKINARRGVDTPPNGYIPRSREGDPP
jgi:hypothetical protein